MSQVLVVVAHPEPASLTQALAHTVAEAAAAAGRQVTVQDLYADGFDPRMPVTEIGTTAFADALTERYAKEVLAADALAVVHPVWFFHVPAILKGWVDRVLRDGVAYDVGPGGTTRGLLRARSALVVNTANSGAEVEGALGAPLESFWRDVILRPGGVTDVMHLRYSKVLGSSAEQRREWLEDLRDQARKWAS